MASSYITVILTLLLSILLVSLVVVAVCPAPTGRRKLREYLSLSPEWSCRRGNPTSWSDVRRAIQKKQNPQKTIIFVAHNYLLMPYYGKLAVDGYKAYANAHANVQFMEIHADASKLDISPYWLRVQEFKRLCDANEDGTIILYCDLDTMIKPKALVYNISDVLDAVDETSAWKWDMYAGCDPFEHGIFAMNSGVIAVRNTAWTRKFINRWLELYPRSNWRKSLRTHQWMCSTSDGKVCKWAQHDYEQGVYNQLWSDNTLNARSHICRLQRSMFSEVDVESDAFIIHLMRGPDERRVQHFERFLAERAADVENMNLGPHFLQQLA